MSGLIALYTTGCAKWINGRSPKLSLHEPGVLLLSKENEVVEIESEYELSAKWLVAGRLDSTRALVDGNSKPVTASVVEANKLWMVLQSRAQKSSHAPYRCSSGPRTPQLCPNSPSGSGNIWKLLKALTTTAETFFLPAFHAPERAFVVPIHLNEVRLSFWKIRPAIADN